VITSLELKETKKKLLTQIAFNISQSEPIDTDKQSDIRGNRLEQRTVKVYDDLYGIKGWVGLKRIIWVKREITLKGKNSTTVDQAFFISSLERPASFFQKAIRGHWAIENSLHYIKDVAFAEDASTIRTKNAPVNFSTIRTISLTLLRKQGFTNIKQAMRLIAFDVKKLYGMLA